MATEKSKTSFDFQAFIEDSKKALLDPKGYFSSMTKTGGFTEPIIKAIIYGLIAGIAGFIWSLLNISATGMLGTAMGVASIILLPIYALIALFVGGVIILVVSAICGGSTDFETNLRVSASLMVIMPVNAILGFIYGISFYLGIFVGLIVSLYGLWMLFNAIVGACKGKEATAKIVAIILAVIVALGSISSMVAVKAVRGLEKYGKDIEKYGKDEEEVQKKAAEMMKKYMKEYKEEE